MTIVIRLKMSRATTGHIVRKGPIRLRLVRGPVALAPLFLGAALSEDVSVRQKFVGTTRATPHFPV